MQFFSWVFALLISFSVQAADSKVVSIPVKGMVCSSCEETITKSLLKLPGVKEVKADHAQGTTVVTLDSKSKTTEADLKSAIKKAGFKVEG